MKLKLDIKEDSKHTDLVSCVGWGSATELYSIGDDGQVLCWNQQTGEQTKFMQLPKNTYAIDAQWSSVGRQPVGASTGSKKSSESLLMATTDGKLMLLSKLGRVEKSTEAHTGAVLAARWCSDCTALVSVGEDGQVKVWSRTLMLRTMLVQSPNPVYGVSWSPDNSQILYTSGKQLIIQSLQPSSKPLQWRAHDGLILAVDWSLLGNLIVSGGEDRKYKVWDSYGRNLYTSVLHDSPIASLSWAPNGEMFAVGAFNTIRLCDRTGWSYSLDKPDTGSLFHISWTIDSTQLAAGCANGQVMFAHVVDRQLEWKNWCATVNVDHTVDIVDLTNESTEHLEFPERVVRASLGWGHLLVATPTQCYIYNSRNWNTPVTMDLKGGLVILIQQAERHFLLVDSVSGLQLISYEGRHICSIKQLGLLPDALNPNTVTICNDTVCVLDQKDEKGKIS